MMQRAHCETKKTNELWFGGERMCVGMRSRRNSEPNTQNKSKRVSKRAREIQKWKKKSEKWKKNQFSSAQLVKRAKWKAFSCYSSWNLSHREQHQQQQQQLEYTNTIVSRVHFQSQKARENQHKDNVVSSRSEHKQAIFGITLAFNISISVFRQNSILRFVICAFLSMP